MLSDATKKRLTEYLGECWHETENPFLSSPQPCKKCGKIFYKNGIALLRPFTTPDDMVALTAKMQEKGEWGNFMQTAERAWWDADEATVEPNEDDQAALIRWLMNPPTFCSVAGEWVEKEG